MPDTDHTWRKITWIGLGIGGFVSAVTVAGGALGYSLPKLASKGDLERVVREQKAGLTRLAGDLKATRRDLTNLQIESYELRMLRLQREIERRKKEGGKADFLDSEIRILKRRTRRARIILDKIDKD